MQTVQLHKLSEGQVGELLGLMRELDPEIEVTGEMLQEAADRAQMYAILEGEHIIATGTLLVSASPTGRKAHIEDVVVSQAYRGRHLGRKLLEHLLEEARKYAPISVHLTSRPSRESANMLYRSLGFVKRDTNVYKLELK